MDKFDLRFAGLSPGHTGDRQLLGPHTLYTVALITGHGLRTPAPFKATVMLKISLLINVVKIQEYQSCAIQLIFPIESVNFLFFITVASTWPSTHRIYFLPARVPFQNFIIPLNCSSYIDFLSMCSGIWRSVLVLFHAAGL